MNNLTILERNQNKLYNYSLGDNLIQCDVKELESDIQSYLRSLNESKISMIESKNLLQSVCDSCHQLLDTVYESKERQNENNTISDYNPVRLVWNVYYIYAGSALEEKCTSYQNILNQMIMSIKRILSMQRDFFEQTKFTQLIAKIEDNSIKEQITYTQYFINQELPFESD